MSWKRRNEMASFEEIMDGTRDSNANVRVRALRQICPCRVKKEIDELWERVFEMITDEDERVRYQVLHTLCDGSPTHMEEKVVEVLDIFRNDKCEKIKRQARRALTSYQRTGKWNIL
eukprot:TRINITY_DN1295_c0_g1_i1.p1 TRINITY_DN1295_c0_g1~~TRINITY_DN1295_c0_g1_i1.p1  ORF type:complete len:117 (+),score=44.81 TRINITY_DN1295_c0_g1_i1:139-489(+)